MKFRQSSVVAWIVGVVLLCDAVSAIGTHYKSDRSQLLKEEYEPTFQNSSYFDNAEFALSSRERHFRQSKFFPLFTIIRFTNEVCRTSSEEHGICHTKTQCAAAGGLALGNCAQGLGVCCRFVVQCGAIITQNGTSFQSPNYPSRFTPTDGSNVCQVRVRRPHNVCQLRLNFIALDIDGPVPAPTATNTAPNDAGACKTDSLAITASGGTVPNLCGNLNGQHIYIDYGTSDTITLNLLMSGTVQRERVWNIEILTIPCLSVVRAPPGCLQYFTGISGQVQSFNFQGGTHLSNMDYSICVRPEDGMRFIDWAPCSPGDVRISGSPATSPTMPMPCGAAATPIPDYLIIMGGVSYPMGTPTAAIPSGTSITDRFCDLTFPSAVTSAYVRSSVRPFILHFRTDSNEIAAANMDASVGFCLRWQQNPQ
ncbi:uncharacterized protein LOC110852632 [Folsomia candida]|uniref:CUB domain-containing protein n=1 Tax=Folsomia candida TaxID=158441 RepID=A0A226E387_FOLCA|nr:uncharacterized protein LOC110852632 [Folsomia candida]OXA52202.1 hypothetical protein Fcan01_13480 [Folsomia candida]